MLHAGDDAPDFTLPGLDGLQYSLHEARGKGPVLLAFWKTGCRACTLSAPYFNRLYDAYENLAWSFWAITQNGVDDAVAFVTGQRFRPTVLVDAPRLEVSDLYDPESTPALFLIEPGRGVTLASSGFDKEALNEVSRRIAGYAGAEYVEVAPEDDGNPPYLPGCEARHR